MPDIVIDLESGEIPGYLAAPTDHLRGGVVVLHEAFGLNDDIRRICDRLASYGYQAVAPELFDRGLRCMMQASRDLSKGEGPLVDRAEEVAGWLGNRPGVDSVGVIGFCMGGGFAFLLGVRGAVSVAAPNYGQPPKDLERLGDSCPIVASYGGRDRLFAKYAGQVAAALARAGVDHDVKVYPGAGHSFMNDADGHRIVEFVGRPLMGVGYRPKEAEDAWRRILEFFDRNL